MSSLSLLANLTETSGSLANVDSGNPGASAVEVGASVIGSIVRVCVERTGGSGAFTVKMYKSASFVVKEVAFEAISDEGDLIDIQPIGGAVYKNSENKAQLFLVVAPASGADNDFGYTLLVEDRE